jgi:hypothetical protein
LNVLDRKYSEVILIDVINLIAILKKGYPLFYLVHHVPARETNPSRVSAMEFEDELWWSVWAVGFERYMSLLSRPLAHPQQREHATSHCSLPPTRHTRVVNMKRIKTLPPGLGTPLRTYHPRRLRGHIATCWDLSLPFLEYRLGWTCDNWHQLARHLEEPEVVNKKSE